jgi:hypothetical protein
LAHTGYAWTELLRNSAGEVIPPPDIVITELVRDWTGHATILSSELNDIGAAMLTLNAGEFLGVKARHLLAGKWSIAPLGRGLYEATIWLREHNHDGTTTVLDIDGRSRVYRLYATRNFYNVFRGEHAVVSIGGENV